MDINKPRGLEQQDAQNKPTPLASADKHTLVRLESPNNNKRRRVRITTSEPQRKPYDEPAFSKREHGEGGFDRPPRGHYRVDYAQSSRDTSRRGQSDNPNWRPSEHRASNRVPQSGPKSTPTKKKKKVTQEPITPVKYPEVIAPDKEIRLNKYLANAGVCSRREADLLIAQGEISVNGEVVKELGRKITIQDVVTRNGSVIESQSKVYVLLNKPKNCVTTSDDPECRLTVIDIVKNACPERIYPVGRLDRNTTGVLLITNDGDLAAKLTHPSFLKKKIYHVWLDKPVSMEHMQAIADGFELEDGEIHADAISYVTEEDFTQVGIEIHSGRNRIVRRIFEHFGYKIRKLDRVYFAGLTKKNLPRGKWRYLNEQEVNNLRMGAFE